MSAAVDTILNRLYDSGLGFIGLLPNILIGLLTFMLFRLVAGLARTATSRVAARTGQPQSIALVFGRLAYWLVLTLGIMVSATIIFPTLNAASLFSALGVGSVAIGFAFKDIFQNLLAGILLLLTRPFRIGDQIVSAEHEGTVEDIQIRATMLRTYDNRLVVIPNAELYTNRLVVNTAKDRRRASVTVGIGYGDDIAQAKQTILAALQDVNGILQDPPPQVLVRQLADFSVNLEVRFWIDPPIRREIVEAEDQVLEVLKRVLSEQGIDLPFPTTQLLFHDQTEKGDGVRSRQREGWPQSRAEGSGGPTGPQP
ncbi:transporter [Deinococcus piscis]|uniref:Transporter n=1 Tax=Deinococcus piscis TaxID=394230 RepID=A0ABQ3KFQ4_9DEIO|nr:mechanosensitive ion channel family protein [Deinococcus piscis]GHG11639.1 transporter [Deinococcus piscis]